MATATAPAQSQQRVLGTSGGLISSRAFAESVCDNLHKQFGVDLRRIFSQDALSDRQKISLAAARLKDAIFLHAHENSYEGFDIAAAEEETDTEPNIAISENDAVYLSNLQGDEVKTYLYNLTKRFENMANAKSPGILVAEMAGGAIIAVGVPMAVTVVKGLIAKQALKAAMLAGVKGIGMKTIIGAVVVVLASLLLYLLLENPKKVLGMVINNTDNNLVVKNYRKDDGDLYIRHGEMVDFMEDNEDGLQSPKIQIKQRLNFGEGNEDNVVFAGIYFADKKFGLYGAEGLMVFTSTTTSLQFAHMYAVPYTNNNRTGMKFLNASPDKKSLFEELYKQDNLRVDFESNGYRFTSTMNDKKGGVVGCIAYIAIT